MARWKAIETEIRTMKGAEARHPRSRYEEEVFGETRSCQTKPDRSAMRSSQIKILLAVPTRLFAILLVTFLVIQLAPGGPVDLIDVHPVARVAHR